MSEEQRYIEHECPVIPCLSVRFDRVNFLWYLDLEEYSIPIQYCPYCGVGLIVPNGTTRMEEPVYQRPIPPLPRHNNDYYLVIGPKGEAYRVPGTVELPEGWRIISRSNPDFYDSEGMLRYVFWNAQIVRPGRVVPWEDT